MNKKIDKSIKKCTACSAGNRSELLHPILKVPICGACNHNIKNADVSISDKNQVSCTWCGCGDGEELFMCDTCDKSFCTLCVERNLGIQVAKDVRDEYFWSCYVCVPEMIKELQVNDDVEYYNIEHAYEIVHPPDITKIIEDYENKLNLLSLEERQFVNLFTGNIGNKLIKEDLIVQYLCAYDLSVINQLSKRLRMFLIEELLILPGLFCTAYGKENHCKLHKHQIISLKQMMKFENQTNEFGYLRGGILADEPGLGKTITTLALITTNAGKYPQQPNIFWDKTSLETNWNVMKGQYHVRLQPILNKLNKQTDSNPFGVPGINKIMKNIEYYCNNIKSFENSGKGDKYY